MRGGPRITVPVAIVLATSVAGGTRPAFAHQAVRLWGAGSATAVDAASESAVAITDLRGIVLGAEGRIAVGPVGLLVGYAEGQLDPTGDVGVGYRHVEGIAWLGAMVLPGLELRGGPRLRAVVRDLNTERWLVWQVGGQYESPVLAPWIRGVARAWVAVGGAVTRDREFGSGRGGAAGIVLRPADAQLEIRLEYAIDQLRSGGGTGGETLEGVSLIVGWGRR